MPGSAPMPASTPMPTPTPAPASSPVPASAPAPSSRRSAAGARSGDGRARTVIVVGAAGGVGTTTLAALVADAVGFRLGVVVQASDHSTGDLAARLPRLEPATSRVGVHDAGAHARAVGPLATPPENAVVLVASATTSGVLDAASALTALAGSADVDLLARTVIVLVDRGRRPAAVDTGPLRAFGLLGIVSLPRDGALVVPGPIVVGHCMPTTTSAVTSVVSLLGW
ncbi:hypothetical protein [Curtobacterium sp. Leaf261]|uniref:hypothetical protein n=1 Tax=Curtobacterium sp. Leaf261 TaxID=1736311 RepID=UPI00191072CC|nr:hypothetical protein [Curtobacterium sp. Leaf261]